MTHYYHSWKSPFGTMHIVCDDQAIKVVAFASNWDLFFKKYKDTLVKKKTDLHEEVIQQIQDYAKGSRKSFNVLLKPEGTEFQKAVWKALLKIPYGQVRSYQYQAEAIKKPKAMRAVGTANGQNPISILIPCHRVIGKDGKLRGYAGGLDSKENLLSLERKFI